MEPNLWKGGKLRNIPITEFRLMKVPEIKGGGSFNLTADGEFFAMVIVPISGFKKDQFQAMAGEMNAAMGKE